MNPVKGVENENASRTKTSAKDKEKENAVAKVDTKSYIIPFVVTGLVVAVTIIMWPRLKAWYLARKLRAESSKEVADV